MKKALYQNETENGEGQSPYSPQYLIDLRDQQTGRIGKSVGRLAVVGKDHPMFQDHCAYMIDQH